ncbi:unnamed protein product [Lampetra planeri]
MSSKEDAFEPHRRHHGRKQENPEEFRADQVESEQTARGIQRLSRESNPGPLLLIVPGLHGRQPETASVVSTSGRPRAEACRPCEGRPEACFATSLPVCAPSRLADEGLAKSKRPTCGCFAAPASRDEHRGGASPESSPETTPESSPRAGVTRSSPRADVAP